MKYLRYVFAKDNMLFAIFPLMIFFMEIVTMLCCYRTLMGFGVLYTFIFSLVIGILCAILASVWGKRGNRIVSIALSAILFVIFATQNVYYTIFKTFTTLNSVGKAGDVLGEFASEAIDGIAKSWLPILLLALPMVLFIVFNKKILPERCIRPRMAIFFVCAAIVFQIGGTVAVKLNNKTIMSYNYVYSETFSSELSVPRFGVLTTLRLDIKNMIVGDIPEIEILDSANDDVSVPVSSITDEEKKEPAEKTENTEDAVKTYGDNVTEIDFDALIAEETDGEIIDMHEYFKSVLPTKQNEYTGMFKDKNLIWIVAEGFSSLAVSEKYTPTLYKLSNEGFVFENFYNPIWGVSTSDGEYTATTGLIPKSGVWSYSRSSENYMPYGFGNIFSSMGYTAKAYHNHTYTYYDRHLSHPNMGYNYKGIGNGLDVEVQWPESDVEMMEKSIPEYINDDYFMTYYMTVSGHLNYNFAGNMMCYKHVDDVADMLAAGYSEGACAYIACQIEFDRAMEYLLEQLENAGKLEDTVIVFSGDHYPYGLTLDEMQELIGSEIEENFELYRSTLVIWNSEMERVEVDKYCSSLDIMPTLANLFGVEYDSRLIMGTDILSDSPALVIFNNRSFITEYGRYNSTTDEFTVNDGMTVAENYAVGVLETVNDKFLYSAKILDNDYYAKVFKNSAEN